MSYSQYGTIQLTDYNNLYNLFLPYWGPGSTNTGYNQSLASIPNFPDKVVADSFWKKLVTDIKLAGDHQGTTLGDMSPVPDTNDLINYFANITRNIESVKTNRLNASVQGSTTTTPIVLYNGWLGSMRGNITITFDSVNKARYFFNAGGQIYFNFAQSGSDTGDNLVKNLFNSIGDVYFSSPTDSNTINILGVNYRGTTRRNGNSNSSVYVNSNLGFYNLGSTDTLIFSATIGGLKLRMWLKYDGNTVISVLYKVTGLPIPNPTTGATTINVNVIKPSTTYLVDTWGNQVVDGSAIGTTGRYLLVGGGAGGHYGAPESYGGGGGGGGQVVNGYFTPEGTVSVYVGQGGEGGQIGMAGTRMMGKDTSVTLPVDNIDVPSNVTTSPSGSNITVYAHGGAWGNDPKLGCQAGPYGSTSGSSGIGLTPCVASKYQTNTGGGSGGGTVIQDSIIDNRFVRQSYGSAWGGFLNTYGIWWPDINSEQPLDVTQTASFPRSGNYTATLSVDNYAYVNIDGSRVISYSDFTSTTSTTFYLSQGAHTVSIHAENYGGPGAVALTITDDATGQIVFGTTTKFILGTAGGGGGGAGGAGSAANNNIGGNGGAGISSNITGTNIVYGAGGGGGGGSNPTSNTSGGTGGTTGGNGGTGLGSTSSGGSIYGTAATQDTGSGGGGGGATLSITPVTATASMGNYGGRGYWLPSYLQKQDGSATPFLFGSSSNSNPTEWIPLLPSLVAYLPQYNDDGGYSLVLSPNNYAPSAWIVFVTASTSWSDSELRQAGIEPSQVIKAKTVWISSTTCGVNFGTYMGIGGMKKSDGVGSGVVRKFVDVVLFEDGPCGSDRGGYSYAYDGKSSPSARFPCTGAILSDPATYTLTDDDVVFAMVKGTTWSQWGWYSGTVQMGYIPDLQSFGVQSSGGAGANGISVFSSPVKAISYSGGNVSEYQDGTNWVYKITYSGSTSTINF